MKENESKLQNVNQLSDLSKRLLHILDTKNVSSYKLQKDNSGIKQTQISHIKSGRNLPSPDLIEKFLKYFPDVNKVWLLTGEGEMLLNESGNYQESNESEGQLSEPESNYKSASVVQVPYYDVDFAGGWSSDEMFSNVQPDFFINNPEFSRCDFACNLVGKSVSKTIPDGSIVGFRIVEDWRTFFDINELYGIITKNDFRTVKRISKTPDGKSLVLKPEPAERYEHIYKDDFDTVPMDFVTKFLQVMAYACFEKIAM